MKKTLKIALPVGVSYFGILFMNLIDLRFADRFGPAATGGLGVATSVFSWFMTTGLAIIFSLEYFIGEAVGKRAHHVAYAWWKKGFGLSLCIGLPISLLTYLSAYLIPFFHYTPAVEQVAIAFLKTSAISSLFIYAHNVSRIYLQSNGSVLPNLVLLVLANVLNYALNSALSARFGVVGLAYSTNLGRFALAFSLGLYAWGWKIKHEKKTRFANLALPPLESNVKAIRLGIPNGLQYLFEVGIFMAATLVAGKFSPAHLAAHQIVLTCASLSFMGFLGFSSAASTLVANAYGEKNFAQVIKLGEDFKKITVAYATLAAGLFLFLGVPLLHLFTHNTEILAIAKNLLLVAGAFQFFDGYQAVLSGLFRGLSLTRIPARAHLIGHWAIGFPAMLLFSFGLHWDVMGVWLALLLALGSVSIQLYIKWSRAMRQFIQ